MKKLLFSLTALALTTVAIAQKKATDVVKFNNGDVIDMGKIPQGIPATATFTVTNISSEPLIIESASPTCGCTIENYTKEPIMPGKEGKITATYNAQALSGFEKHMNVKFAGVDEIKSITFKGEVLTTEEYAKIKGNATPPAATTVKATETKTTTVSNKQAPKAAKKRTVTAKTKTTTTVTKSTK